MTNSENKTQNVWKERKENCAGFRAIAVARLANAAMSEFRSIAGDSVNDELFAEFCKLTKDATIVFTQPSEETLKADAASENPRFSKGRAFGSVQWYKKTQVVESVLNVISSFSSFVSYMETKENQAERDDKKLAAAAALLGLTLEELKAMKK